MASVLKVDTVLKANGNGFPLSGFVGPTFKAYKSAAQNSVTHNGGVKVTFETEVWDSDSCYNTSNSRFTPDVAGYYLITAQLEISHAVDEARVMGMLYKNGSEFMRFERRGTDIYLGGYSLQSLNFTVDDDASVSDYYEVYGYFETIDSTYTSSGYTMANFFKGFKLIT